jgi:hypothetical protein
MLRAGGGEALRGVPPRAAETQAVRKMLRQAVRARQFHPLLLECGVPR